MPKGQFTAADVTQPKGQFTEADVTSGAGAYSAAQPQESFGSRLTAGYNPGAQDFADKHPTLGPAVRFLDAAGGAALSVPLSIYHAFADDPSPQEQEEFKGHTRIPGELSIERLTGGPLVRGVEQWLDPKTRPTAKQAVSVLPEALGQGVGTVAGAEAIPAGQALAKKGVEKVLSWNTGLQALGHDTLNKAADAAKQKLWDAHNMVSARVGMLKDDIANADIQDGEPKIPIGDLIPKIDQLASDYKAAGGALPSFDKAVKAIANRDNPYLTFEEAADLRTEIGSLSAKAAKGTRDAGATAELEQALKQKLTDRANELDMSKQFESYNGLWSTLKGYEESGPIGKLQNAQSGYDFFNALRDPKTGAALRRSVDSLSDFGLPKNFASNLIKDNGKLHDYTRATGGPMNVMGKIKAFARHPVAGGLGYVAGHAVGGFVGGTLGAIGGAKLADNLSAMREFRKLGVTPDTTGEMKQFDAKPSGKPLERGAQPDPTVKNELIQALKSQGLDSKSATAAAIRAIQKNPKGDFGQLFSDAIRRP